MASTKVYSELSDSLLAGSEKAYSITDAPERASNERWWKWLSFAFISCFIIFSCLIIGLAGGRYATSWQSAENELQSKHTTACKQPALRKEWRSLDKVEKLNYTKAVQCLKSIPSHLGLNQTLYDDFPWVHMHSGETCMSDSLNTFC